MSIPHLFRLSWWMKRIPQKDKATHVWNIAGNVGRHPPAHRLAADDESFRLILRRGFRNHRPITRLQFRLWVWYFPLLFHVIEVEFDCEESAACELSLEVVHEG